MDSCANSTKLPGVFDVILQKTQSNYDPLNARFKVMQITY